jgi:hypothetical protein
MPRSATNDRQFLEMHGGKWRVSLAVPRELQDRLGTRLKRPLNTDSLALANSMKWQVVAELRGAIERARGGSTGASLRGDPLLREALEVARLRARAQSEAEREGLDFAIHDRAEEIAGNPIGEEPDPLTGETQPVYDEAKERRAKHYAEIAYGRATPIGLHHAQFIVEAGNKRRTEGDDHTGPLSFSWRGASGRACGRCFRPSPAKWPSGSETHCPR